MDRLNRSASAPILDTAPRFGLGTTHREAQRGLRAAIIHHEKRFFHVWSLVACRRSVRLDRSCMIEAQIVDLVAAYVEPVGRTRPYCAGLQQFRKVRAR
jgi:hypothetical protein